MAKKKVKRKKTMLRVIASNTGKHWIEIAKYDIKKPFFWYIDVDQTYYKKIVVETVCE